MKKEFTDQEKLKKSKENEQRGYPKKKQKKGRNKK
jgi:hypothetical protein